MLSRFTPLLASALLLGGCGTYNGGVDSIYQPVVQRNDYVLDVVTSGYALAPDEANRLAGWMASMGLRYGDQVAVDDGAGRADGVRQQIAALAGQYGLQLSDQTPVTVGEIAPGTARVIITRMTAGVPGCPDFSRQYQPDFSASTSSNFGCATNSNLAAMVASPGDLVRGAPGGPTTDAAIAGKAIRALRGAAPTGAGGTALKSESTGGNR
jgi:pilus assembly protein CpaD